MVDLTGKKILVVEDNKMIRRQLSGMLSKYGAQVIQAGDGEEGRYAFVKDIPVIMLTGNKESGDKKKGEKSGATLYLTKPVPGAEILAAITDLL